MNSNERIESLIDSKTWRPYMKLFLLATLTFKDQKSYPERLEAQLRTGLQDAVQTGTGLIDGIPVALGFGLSFHGRQYGFSCWRKITRLMNMQLKGLTVILICASGGARMQEGILSLMQMAKISAACSSIVCKFIIYFSTNITYRRCNSKFAMLGDLIFAEPKAVIGFAGRRVIEQTLQEQLPDNFQTAEYLLHHGLIDLIICRSF
jgi:acetyl-CoA carboxylase carboxyl transferase subunit beta